MRLFRRSAPPAVAISIVAAALTGPAGPATALAGPDTVPGVPSVPALAGPATPAGALVETPVGTLTGPSTGTLIGAPTGTSTRPLSDPPSGPPPTPASHPDPAPADAQAQGQVCGPPYLDDDPNLGPKYLPKTGPLAGILKGYVPLNRVPPHRFIERYWDTAANGWRYPPDRGFAHSGGYINGKPIVRAVTLYAGRRLDRFGGERGSYLAPLGASYIGRALPPSNLNTYAGAPQYVCNYHAYEVVKEFKVDAGPAAPAFQQPGRGTQYHVTSRHIPEAPQSSPDVSVEWLVQNGYLKRLN
ncbi:hypothetical protein FHS43_001718 [Streptosporangium becharense]|uniref:TNT domain-containing protein n=1 Tax=Streptosporangium becharense TaxID=1816182 RepID=A0A7W9MK31_9ACTN|nr:TNT domain-containing protein [Streptosporangium becharense]MBB2910455.1 hypothetical protein [Streptosporangium becharense]MBB5823198.1 hypothetical protein [Streptosporangium becharense]